MEIPMARINLIAPRFSTLGLLEGIRSVAEDEKREADRLRTLSLIETDRLNQANARIQNNILSQTGLRLAEANINNVDSQITTRAGNLGVAQGNLSNNTRNTTSQIETRAGNLGVAKANLSNNTRNTTSQITTRAGNLGVAQGNLGVAQKKANQLSAAEIQNQNYSRCVLQGGDPDTCAIRFGIRNPPSGSNTASVLNAGAQTPLGILTTEPINQGISITDGVLNLGNSDNSFLGVSQ